MSTENSLVTRSDALKLRARNREKREATFVASTDAVDSYGEIVEQSWRLERYLANPVVLYGHMSRELPIGQAVSCGLVDGNLECTVRFASADANPMAEQVWRLVEEGCLRAVSVGFVPNEVRMEKREGQDVYVLAQNELHEISVVPIPANPEALAKMRAKARELASQNQSQPAQRAVTETHMLTAEEIKALQDKLAQREAAVATAEKQASDATARATALEAQNKALVAERDEARSELTAAQTLISEMNSAAIEKDVEALVGKKIMPAEREVFVKLAKTDRKLFDDMIAQRSDLKILGAAIVQPETQQENTTAQEPTSDDLAAEAFKAAQNIVGH